MKRTQPLVLALAIFTGALTLMFQNCQKLPTSSEVSGEMTTRIAMDLPKTDLESLVKSYYRDILGREPSAQEVAQTVAQLRSGLSADALRQQLAGSQEAITAITNLFTQYFGAAAPGLSTYISYWSSQLGTGTYTLDDLKRLLGIT